MQYTQEQVEKYFTDHGCTLLSRYVNVKSPLYYIGICGHKARATSFEAVRRRGCSFKCPACSPKISYSDDAVRAFVEGEGCELLEIRKERHEKNKRLYKTIRIVCTCGHEHTLAYEKFRSGQGRICPACSRPKGERHFAYNANLTEEDRLRNRDLWENILWRRNVFKRDKYACQRCGANKGGNLVAHHLDAWSQDASKRFVVDNGVTLCVGCHKAFHHVYGYGHNTKAQYDEWMNGDNTEVIAETKESATP